IEEHYKNSGKRKRLYLDIREKIRQIVERIRQESPKPLSTPQPPHPSPEPTRHPPPATRFSGTTKIAFCNRLGHDWKGLADVLGVSAADQARFERGDEARGLWVWLENRRRLPDLVPALADINREDLVRLLKTP
nr:hypothetical protein [Nitrospirales bacterium]